MCSYTCISHCCVYIRLPIVVGVAVILVLGGGGVHVYYINESQLPWLRTAIYHTGLDVKMEVTQCTLYMEIHVYSTLAYYVK